MLLTKYAPNVTVDATVDSTRSQITVVCFIDLYGVACQNKNVPQCNLTESHSQRRSQIYQHSGRRRRNCRFSSVVAISSLTQFNYATHKQRCDTNHVGPRGAQLYPLRGCTSGRVPQTWGRFAEWLLSQMILTGISNNACLHSVSLKKYPLPECLPIYRVFVNIYDFCKSLLPHKTYQYISMTDVSTEPWASTLSIPVLELVAKYTKH